MLSYAMALRSQIFDHIVEKLSQIDGTVHEGFGSRPVYQMKTGPIEVSRQFLYLDQINNFPSVFLVASTEQVVHIGGGIRYHSFPLLVRGYCYGQDPEDLLDDIEWSLEQTKYTCQDMVDVRVLGVSTDEGLLDPYGLCDVSAQVIYERSP